MFLKSFIFLSLISHNIFAQTNQADVKPQPSGTTPSEEFKVRQILNQKKILVVQASQSAVVSSQDVFVISLPDDTQCELTVQSVNATFINLDMSSCGKSSLITLKSPIEKALSSFPAIPSTGVQAVTISAPPPVPNSEKPVAPEVTVVNSSISDLSNEERRPHFSFGVNLSTMNSFYFPNARAKDSNGNLLVADSAKFSTDMGAGVNASVLLWGSHSWGFSAGGFYEFSRDVDSVSSGGNSSSYKNLKVSLYGTEINMIYRWGRWYLPFGLNYAMIDPENHVGTITVTAGLGTQVGAGIMVSRHHSFELMAKLVSFSVQEYNSYYNATVDYGTGYGSGMNGSWRFIF